MPVKSFIVGHSDKHIAEVDSTQDEAQALVVATRPLKTYDVALQFFTNDVYGIEMAQNVTPTGTPEVMYKENLGTPTEWDVDSIQGGKFDPARTNRPRTGTYSIRTDNAAVNNILEWDRGSDVAMSGYASITMWVNVDKDWKGNDSIELYGWDTNTASQVGVAIGLEDYFDYSDFDTWHKLSIPLSDMGLSTSTLDAFRMEIISKQGKSPKFWIDDMQLEENTGDAEAIDYTIRPETGEWLYVNTIRSLWVAPYDSTEGNGTVPNIPYDSFLGIGPLDVGVLYQRLVDDEVTFSLSVKQLSDLLQLAGTKISNMGGDSTTTWMTVDFTLDKPIVLKSDTTDYMRVRINDDMSGLTSYRVSILGYTEQRT